MEEYLITHSKYYSPAFNAAIYDGPFRIYFTQHQESLALKVYFFVQQRLKEAYRSAKDLHRKTGLNFFIMLYPNVETFRLSFESFDAENPQIHLGRLGADSVLGAAAYLEEKIFDDLLLALEKQVKKVIPPQTQFVEESPSL